MRTVLSSCVFLIAVACSARPTGDTGSTEQRGPLAADAVGQLGGHEVVATSDGPWQVRSTRGAGGPRGRIEAKRALARGSSAYAMDVEAEVADEDLADGAVAGLVAGDAPAPTASAESTAVTIGHASADFAPMRAGTIDDNDDLSAFLEFLAEQRQREHLAGLWRDLDVARSQRIRVVDESGMGLPGLPFQVVDEGADRVVWRGTTYGDGTCPYYPGVANADGGDDGSLLIEVRRGERIWRQHWDGTGEECTVTIHDPGERPSETVLDVVFLIDTTGSMGDEIDRIKGTLLSLTERLRSLGLEFDLRYGAVLYRDVGDEYLTRTHPFTADIETFDTALQQIEANGGGDGPESLNQGIAVAVDGMDWRPDAARVVFLIADAPPHMDYDGDVGYDVSLREAVAKGIRIHAVAASGLDDAGSIVFRQIAQFTRGDFVFIEYGGDTAASARDHGISAPAKSNNLDEILYARILDEIARWGRE